MKLQQLELNKSYSVLDPLTQEWILNMRYIGFDRRRDLLIFKSTDTPNLFLYSSEKRLNELVKNES